MKSILTALLTVLLIPINANAAETPPDVTYLIEVCQKAYPQDSKAAGQCFLKAAGFDPDAPPPTREELVSLYGELDDPKHVEEIQGHWAKEMLANQSSYLACKGQLNFYKCFLEAADQELAIHEHLFESLKPPAWPSSAGTRYAITHASRATLRAFMGCESLASAEKATCLKKINETDEIDRNLSAGQRAYLEKGLEQVKRYQAARERKIRSLDQQLRVEESRSQREHKLELARIQALGMFLGSRPFSWQQPMPTYQPPPPIQYAPVYQAPPVRPPVNCTTNTVGQYTYTNCN